MSDLNSIAVHIHKEVAKIKRKPLLSRNDFIRAHRVHKIHWERESLADMFRSMWESCTINVQVIKVRKPFIELLTAGCRVNKKWHE